MTHPRPWLTLGLMSALYFIITAATFDSLGLVLPAMVADLHWSWTQAGTGFGLLAIFCGITATVPATLVRRFGVRANLLIGSLVMGSAFACLSRTTGLVPYFAGASLAGLGFTLAGHGARHLSAGAGVRAAILRLRAVFHHRRAGRCGRTADLFRGHSSHP